MKYKAIFLILLSTLSLMRNAYADSVFSFSGLNWNDSMSTADEKLKANGNGGISTFDKIRCSVTFIIGNSCSCRFEGAGLGFGDIFFNKKGKLTSVLLWVEDKDRTLKILTKKYGKPMVFTPATSGNSLLDFTEAESTWKSTNGETLNMRGGFVHYESNQEASLKDKDRQDSRF